MEAPHLNLHPNPLRERIEQRLKELKTEYTSGQRMLTDLEHKQLDLRNLLLQVGGAIQVLEEILAEEES